MSNWPPNNDSQLSTDEPETRDSRNTPPRQLFTILGIGFGLAVIIGNTIGAGIFRTPGVIAAGIHSFWPYISTWILGALYAFLGANALAELGTLVPRSGGQYVFVRKGLGDLAGFIVGWSDWISTCGTSAAIAIVIGEYMIGFVAGGGIRIQQGVAVAVVMIFTFIQWLGIRSGSATQNATSVVKALALLFFIAVCFAFSSHRPWSPTVKTPAPAGGTLLAFIVALQAVVYTYDGWSAVIYFSEEMTNHEKNIPRAMFGGLLSVTIIYLLINIGCLGVVTLPAIAGNKFVAGVVVDRIFGAAGQNMLRALLVLIFLSAVSANMLMAPRVIYAMAKDGLFWHFACGVNRGGTPAAALMISSILTAALIVTNTFETVIAKLAFFFVANYTLSFLTLFVLRGRESAAPRSYRAWGHPFTTALGLAASLAFLGGATAGDLRNSIWALALLTASVPMYLLMKRSLQ
jgi:APA family basic amino acid/polyamine antiporter